MKPCNIPDFEIAVERIAFTPNHKTRHGEGPELASQYLADRCQDKVIELCFIQPGKPERFNRSYRAEVLNNWLFTSLDEVREITHQWLQSYNEEGPHDDWEASPDCGS